MGVVYIAEDTTLRRQVAVKFSASGEAGRGRLLEEARSASSLNHPNIARIYECAEDPPGRLYVVMELVHGKTLHQMVKDGELTQVKSVRVLEYVLAGLAEAHRQGIIHRDIKPSNVMVDRTGAVKILDFGLATRDAATWTAVRGLNPDEIETQHMTVSHNVVGTPAFMSPEQAKAGVIDARSDLFACGSLLYVILTGQAPFAGSTSAEVLGAVLYVDPKRPSELVPGIPEALDRIVMKALAKDPADRYQSAEEMRLDLSSLRSDLSGSSKLVSAAVPLPAIRPWMKARDWAIAGIAIALLAAGAYWWFNPSPERPNANAKRWYDQGLEALRDGTYFSAKTALERVTQTDPAFAAGHARLADAWAELDSTENAKEELLLALKKPSGLRPRSATDERTLEAIQATITHDYPLAIVRYRELMKSSPEPEKSRAWLDLGRIHEKANRSSDDIVEAVRCYSEAIKLDREYAAAFLRRGVLLGRQRKLAEAESDFRQAQTVFETSRNQEGVAAVFYERGTLLGTRNDYAGGIPALERSREIARVDGNEYQELLAQIKIGVLRYHLGESAVAEKLLTDAIERARERRLPFLTARGMIDLSAAQYNRRDLASAERNAREALALSRREKLDRLEALANFYLGSIVTSQGYPDKALPHHEAALQYYRRAQFAQESLRTQIGLARERRELGDHPGARSMYLEAVKTAESLKDRDGVAFILQDLGILHSRWERWVEALDWFRKAAEVTTTRSGQAYLLGGRARVLARLGDLPQARVTAREAAEKAGDSADAKARGEVLQRFLAFREGRWAEVVTGCRKELQSTPSLADEIDTRIHLVQALTRSGQGAQAWREAEVLLKRSEESKVEFRNSFVWAAASEAALVANRPQDALAYAARAENLFRKHDLPDSSWKANAVAARAATLQKDTLEAAKRVQSAETLLTQFETVLGVTYTKSYETLADTNWYRRLIQR